MSSTQRATIVTLLIAAVVVWGLGLRAALRPGARADQESTASSAVADTPAMAATSTTSRPTATPTSSSELVSVTPTPTRTPFPSPAATASPTATPLPSATPTRQPSSTPSPTATARQQVPPTLPPVPAGTPVIPQAGRFLLANQDEQLLHVYEDGIEIRTIPISTGRPVANAFTPAWRGDVGRFWGNGPFLNYENLWSDHMWYLFPGARGSILIHSVPYTRDGDQKIYDHPDALGIEPTSHGCVRISPQDAEWLESWDPVGVPIEITPWSGEIGPPDESL